MFCSATFEFCKTASQQLVERIEQELLLALQIFDAVKVGNKFFLRFDSQNPFFYGNICENIKTVHTYYGQYFRYIVSNCSEENRYESKTPLSFDIPFKI